MKKEAKKLTLLVAWCCLPSVVISIFDPGFGLIAAPFIFVITAACAFIAFIVLKICMLPERASPDYSRKSLLKAI